MPKVIFKDVFKKFDDVEAVKNLNLEINDGEFVVFLGPSGCGKTTSLRMIAGLEDPTDGKIFIDEQEITGLNPAKRNVAMVFQSYALYPHMTTLDNIVFPLKMSGIKKIEREKKGVEVAKLLNIEKLLKKKPPKLSGGEQQRVALARAIIREPKVFLLDEPLSNLDAKLRVKMRFELRKLLKEELKITTIYVTHDQIEAMTMADRIAIMSDGSLQQVGTPIVIFNEPINIFVAEFIGSPPMNLFECKIVMQNSELVIDTGKFILPIPQTYKEYLLKRNNVIIGFRSQHIDIKMKAQDAYIKGELLGVERLGTEMLGHVSSGSEKNVILNLSPDSTLMTGDIIYWLPRPEKMYFFDSETKKTIYL